MSAMASSLVHEVSVSYHTTRMLDSVSVSLHHTNSLQLSPTPDSGQGVGDRMSQLTEGVDEFLNSICSPG